MKTAYSKTLADWMMETAYSKTLALLEEVGWCQGGDGRTADGRLCLENALVEAIKESYFGDTMIKACDAIRSYIGQQMIYRWNDDPDRTFADVRYVLTVLHNREIEEIKEVKLMEIGEPVREVEFEPTETPIEAPVEPVPVETPERELEPA